MKNEEAKIFAVVINIKRNNIIEQKNNNKNNKNNNNFNICWSDMIKPKYVSC